MSTTDIYAFDLLTIPHTKRGRLYFSGSLLFLDGGSTAELSHSELLADGYAVTICTDSGRLRIRNSNGHELTVLTSRVQTPGEREDSRAAALRNERFTG